MTKTREIYRCPICGNIVEVLHGGAVLSCCGKPMLLLQENVTDGAHEKHVPVVERTDRGYSVRVGTTEHPMTADHYIEWIELLTPRGVLRRDLRPGDKPEATFCMRTDGNGCHDKAAACDTAAEVTARAYCNLHGLWRGHEKK